MNGLCVDPSGAVMPILVTAFGDIKITPETWRQLDEMVPGWFTVTDRRTRTYKRLRAIERDIAALAEAMWLTGDELTEI